MKIIGIHSWSIKSASIGEEGVFGNTDLRDEAVLQEVQLIYSLLTENIQDLKTLTYDQKVDFFNQLDLDFDTKL